MSTNPPEAEKQKLKLPPEIPLESNIIGLKDLFLSNVREFRRGSTLLITGPPGAGKTTFALALARSMINHQEENWERLQAEAFEKEGSDPAKTQIKPASILYLLSLEMLEKQLKEVYEPMGWFTSDDKILNLDGNDETTMRVISVRPAFDRPVASSAEVTNELLMKLQKSLDANDVRNVFVIVDSISALSRDTGTILERRRQTHELKAHLQSAIAASGSKLAMTMFLAERSGGPHDATSSVEEYLADTVIRLDLQPQVMGRRLRTLEVVKSQGINMMVGQHTWAIVSNIEKKKDGNAPQKENDASDSETVHAKASEEDDKNEFPGLIFDPDCYGRELYRSALHWRERKCVEEAEQAARTPSGAAQAEKSGTSFRQWGTVAIFPRLRSLPLSESRVKEPTDGKKNGNSKIKTPRGEWIDSGTLGLDQMLHFDRGKQYWYSTRSGQEDGKEGIRRGHTTLLVGPPGTGKSTILLQFLFAACLDNRDAKNRPTGGRGMYVTFDQERWKTRDSMTEHWGRWKIEFIKNLLPDKPPVQEPPDDERLRELLDRDASDIITHYPVRHSKIDINLIIAQLKVAIVTLRRRGLTRLALDGVSEWLSTCNDEHESGPLVLEALLTSLNEAGQGPLCDEKGKELSAESYPPITMMIAYETQVGTGKFPKEVVGVLAENILSLDQVHLAEATRRMIYVVKSSGQNSDSNPREVIFQSHPKKRQIEIRPGFDEHAGLIEGKIREAKVVLQLFEENAAQRRYNKKLVKKLKDFRDLQYKALIFHSTEIARTLEETDVPTHFPPSDLMILEVDEWWISRPFSDKNADSSTDKPSAAGESSTDSTPKGTPETGPIVANTSAADDEIDDPHRGNNDGPTHPLIPLTDLWRPRLERAELTSWKEFWFCELDKAMRWTGKKNTPYDKHLKGNLHAIPAYMDYAMFCVNLKRLQEICIMKDQEVQGPFQLENMLDPLEKLMKTHSTNKKKKTKKKNEDPSPDRWPDQDEKTAALATWQQLMRQLPKRWLDDGSAEGLASPDERARKMAIKQLACLADGADLNPARSLVELGEYLRRHRSTTEAFFAVDLSTHENCVCLFFEFAWAFGGSENFLKKAAQDDDPKTIRQRQRAEKAAICSLFFLQYLVMSRLMPMGMDSTTAANGLFSRHWHSTFMASRFASEDSPEGNPPLMLLPFWPVAANGATAFEAALEDAEYRTKRFVGRLMRSLKTAQAYYEKVAKNPEALDVAPHINALKACGDYITEEKKIEEKAKGLFDPDENHTPEGPNSRRLQNLLDMMNSIIPLFESTRKIGTPPQSYALRLALSAATPFTEPDADNLSTPVAGFVDLAEYLQWNCLRISVLVYDAQGKPSPLSNALLNFKVHPLPQEAIQDKAIARLSAHEEAERRSALSAQDGETPPPPSESELENPQAPPAQGEQNPPVPPSDLDEMTPLGSGLCSAGCTGSWMYAVHQSSRSVSIARDIIQEMTSAVSARDRAYQGAGVPPRKDFYQSCGNQSVPSAEHFSWWDLLRYNMAFARRRDRVLPLEIDAAELYKLIRELMFRCVEFADAKRIPQSGLDSVYTAADFEANLGIAWELAEQAVGEITTTIRNRQKKAPSSKQNTSA